MDLIIISKVLLIKRIVENIPECVESEETAVFLPPLLFKKNLCFVYIFSCLVLVFPGK